MFCFCRVFLSGPVFQERRLALSTQPPRIPNEPPCLNLERRFCRIITTLPRLPLMEGPAGSSAGRLGRFNEFAAATALAAARSTALSIATEDVQNAPRIAPAALPAALHYRFDGCFTVSKQIESLWINIHVRLLPSLNRAGSGKSWPAECPPWRSRTCHAIFLLIRHA